MNFESRRFWKVNHQEVTQEEPMRLHHHQSVCLWVAYKALHELRTITRSFEREAMTFFWKTEKQPLVQEEAPPVCPNVFWIVQFAIVSGWRTNMLTLMLALSSHCGNASVVASRQLWPMETKSATFPRRRLPNAGRPMSWGWERKKNNPCSRECNNESYHKHHSVDTCTSLCWLFSRLLNESAHLEEDWSPHFAPLLPNLSASSFWWCWDL